MQTLAVRRRVEGNPDRHGNPTVTYATSTPWVVRGLAPGAATEPSQPNRETVVVEWTVFADPSAALPAARDLVVVDGKDFEVVATPQDWTRGPWPHPTAGVVVELKHWEG